MSSGKLHCGYGKCFDMSSGYDVYGVGNSLVDIQARIDDSILEGLQFPKGIMTLVDELTQTRVLQSIRGAKISRCAGGSAANTIAGLVDFGGTAAYAGKTGADELGEFWLKDMRQLGVAMDSSTTAASNHLRAATERLNAVAGENAGVIEMLNPPYP